jgi:hypothetical protein
LTGGLAPPSVFALAVFHLDSLISFSSSPYFVPLTERGTWAQNGRKTQAFWAQIKGYQVSKGSRINRNFAVLWSGRWDVTQCPRYGILFQLGTRQIPGSEKRTSQALETFLGENYLSQRNEVREGTKHYRGYYNCAQNK